MENIRERLAYLVIQESEREDIELSDCYGKKLFEDLNYDSVSIISLIVAIENEFDIQFDDEELLIEKINDFEEMLEYINRKIQE